LSNFLSVSERLESRCANMEAAVEERLLIVRIHSASVILRWGVWSFTGGIKSWKAGLHICRYVLQNWYRRKCMHERGSRTTSMNWNNASLLLNRMVTETPQTQRSYETSVPRKDIWLRSASSFIKERSLANCTLCSSVRRYGNNCKTESN